MIGIAAIEYYYNIYNSLYLRLLNEIFQFTRTLWNGVCIPALFMKTGTVILDTCNSNTTVPTL